MIDEHPRTHLFILRLWIEDLGDGKTEWRGKIQHVLSGDAHYFRDWQVLQQFIKAHSNIRATDMQHVNQEEISPSS